MPSISNQSPGIESLWFFLVCVSIPEAATVAERVDFIALAFSGLLPTLERRGLRMRISKVKISELDEEGGCWAGYTSGFS